MNKEQLQAAISEMLDGMDSGNYHDELTMLLTVVDSTSDEGIAAAWAKVHIDDDEYADAEGGAHDGEE
jgi:hypothetical protein